MGTPDFAVESLEAILEAGYSVVGVVTVPDRQTGRGLKITCSAVKECALKHNLPLLQPEKLRDEDFQQQLRAWNADLFVVVAFRMLPKSVWAMPPMGTFNLHASLLPQYRGAAPINWALINGEKETGITTFLLNEKIDEGEILLQQKTAISPDDNAGTLHDRLALMGRKLVVETIQGLMDHTLQPRRQEECKMPIPGQPEFRPAPKIFKADCAIDWNRNGEELVNFVRGLSPYPAATMMMEDNKGQQQTFKIYEISFEKDPSSALFSVNTDGKNYLKIGNRDGFINILSLQLNGKRKNSIAEFLRGYSVSDWKIVM